MKHIFASLAVAALSAAAAQAQSDWTYLECDLEQRTQRPPETNIWNVDPEPVRHTYRLRVQPQPEVWRLNTSFSWWPVCGPNSTFSSACRLSERDIGRAEELVVNESTNYSSNRELWTFTLTRNTLFLTDIKRWDAWRYDSASDQDITTADVTIWTEGGCEVGEEPVDNRPPPPPNRF